MRSASMQKPDLPGVRSKSAKGRRYWYLEGGESRTRLPDPDDPGFVTALARAQAGQKAVAGQPRNFTRLVGIYRKSKRYRRLAPRTKADYERILTWVERTIGGLPPALMEQHHVIRAVEENERRVWFANMIKAVLSVLFGEAIRQGWMKHNPAKGVEGIGHNGPPMHRPWPESALAAFLKCAGQVERTIALLAVGTGQRISDILRMRWDQIAGGGIHVKQGKTAARLWIPLPPDLAEHLGSIRREGLTIVAGRQGRPLSYDAARKRIMRVRVRSETAEWTIHGWRYTAAADLAAGGATDDEVASITGHKSVAMLKLYSGDERQRWLAASAQSKRNRGGPDGIRQL